jgi:hypothetical protein
VKVHLYGASIHTRPLFIGFKTWGKLHSLNPKLNLLIFSQHGFGVGKWVNKHGGQNNVAIQTTYILYVATLALGLQPRQWFARLRAKRGRPKVTFHAPGNTKECEGMNLHTSKWIPILGDEVSMDSWIFRGQLQGSKPITWKSFLYHWKDIWM